MTVRKLDAAAVGLPHFDPGIATDGDVFTLSSHQRARMALEFGLGMPDPGFNMFVVGEDRSGRMTATLDYLGRAVADRRPPDDWVYLNNFRRPQQPRPFRLEAGGARRIAQRIGLLLPQLREALARAFTGEAYEAEVQRVRTATQGDLSQRMAALQAEAKQAGLDILQTPQGPMIAAVGPDGQPAGLDALPEEKRAAAQAAAETIAERMQQVQRDMARIQVEFAKQLVEVNRTVAATATSGLIDAAAVEFQGYHGIGRWFIELREDVIDRHADFLPRPDGAPAQEPPEQRYAVNVFVDNGDTQHPRIVLEANPTYQNLFGRIEYRPLEGGLTTDFTLIRAGALHRANGGVLVLRADALAENPESWTFLKGALRDRCIQIEEPYRTASVPLAGAPKPEPIPLDVKVVIAGAPRWYYAFFSVDPDFQTYFKIKADIDADMDATRANLDCYGGLIRAMAKKEVGADITDDAVARLLAVAARWAAHREKLSARFEMIEDVLVEAAAIARAAGGAVDAATVDAAIDRRRARNGRVEDRMQEAIRRGTIMIDTADAVLGQINALVVRDLGDHAFGAPSRVTARASVGRLGIINIERDVELGGPIQQKGAMVLQGFLAGHFARRFPLSFNVSITFEQSYGGVEGDSASLAEILAILSDLAGLPLRQDLAITGSMNQLGESQAIGGAHHKIEGFFRTCVEAGGLTGSQGVVIPRANEEHLVLRPEVAQAVAEGRFHIWSVETVDEAVALFTGLEAGAPDTAGNYPPDSVYGRAMAQIETFDRILKERVGSL